MVTNTWVDTDAIESVGNLDSHILNYVYIILFVQTLKIVRNRVASPKDGLWLQIVLDIVEHGSHCVGSEITIEIAPFTGSFLWFCWQSTISSAA